MTSHSATNEKKGTQIKSKTLDKVLKKAGAVFKKAGDNPDKLRDYAKDSVDSMAPGVGTISDKTIEYGIKATNKAREDKHNPATGVTKEGEGEDYSREGFSKKILDKLKERKNRKKNQ